MDPIEVSDRTQFDAMARLARGCPDGVVVERPGLLMLSTGIPMSFFNVAFVTEPVSDPDGAMAEVRAFFEPFSLPWRVSWRIGVADQVGLAAVESGLRPAPPMEGMVTERFPDQPPIEDLSIGTVGSLGDMKEHVDVLEVAFEAPKGVLQPVICEPTLADEGAVFLVGHVDGEPVATSAVYVTGEIAGIYNVATMPGHRGKGFGAALTIAAMREGLARGCTVAALQPSAMGRPIYSKLGYNAAALYLQFVTPPPRQDAAAQTAPA